MLRNRFTVFTPKMRRILKVKEKKEKAKKKKQKKKNVLSNSNPSVQYL